MTHIWVNPFISKYLPTLAPGNTTSRFLNLLTHPESKATEMLPLLENNPFFNDFLMRSALAIKSKSKIAQQEPPDENDLHGLSVQKIFGFLGLAGTRNMILSLELLKKLGKGLPRKEGEEYSPDPTKQLPFALEVLEFTENKRMAYSNTAFISGYLFDCISVVFQKHHPDIKSIPETLKELWKKSLRTACISYGIARNSPKLENNQFAFSGALLLEIGKPFMNVLFANEQPNYSDFLKKSQEMNFSSLDFDLVFEKRKYQVNYFALSALMVSTFPVLSKIEKAIYHHREPYFLKNSSIEEFPLASIYYTAFKLAQINDIEKKPHEIDKVWKNAESLLSPLGIKRPHLDSGVKFH